LFTIAETSTNLVIETTVVYGAIEGRFGGEIASIVAFGMASVGVKARGYLPKRQQRGTLIPS
jgi:hypothetical protein